MSTNKKYKFLIYAITTFVGFWLRYYLLEDRNSWHDEWHSIYVSDPNISFEETIDRYLGNKGDSFLTEYYPILYLLLLKYFFYIFGYIDDVGRIFSLFFGVITIPLLMYICDKYFKIKNLLIPGLLASCNLFLIWQSLEIRAHSVVVFFVLLNILFFFEIIKSKKILISLLYFLISIFTLSLWPIAGTIFAGKFLYLVNLYRKEKVYFKHINLLFLLIPIFYIILNKDYLMLNLSRDDHYTKLYSTFFYNYHFRTFFGSVFAGGFFLLLFAYVTLKNFKNLFKNNSFQNILFYIVLTSYFLTLSYSIIRGAPIMSPKYVIFLVPLILIIISNFVDKSRFKNLLILAITIVASFNIYLNYFNWPIKRPDIKNILKILNEKKGHVIVSVEKDVFNNYIKNTKNFKKYEFVLYKQKIEKDIDSFWLICENYPSYAYGDIKKTNIEKKCLIDFDRFDKLEFIKTRDIYLAKFIKKQY